MQRIEALASAWAQGEEHKWWCSLDLALLLKILQQHALWDTLLTCCSLATTWMNKYGNEHEKIIQSLLMAGVRAAGKGALASGNMNLLRRVMSCMAFILFGQCLMLTTPILSGRCVCDVILYLMMTFHFILNTILLPPCRIIFAL